MQTQTTTVIASLSGTGLLAAGWLVALLLLLVGRLRGRRVVFGWGVIVAGLMVLATPEAVYLYFAFRDGVFQATPVDLLLLGMSGFLGGAIAYVGTSYLRERSPRTSPAPGP